MLVYKESMVDAINQQYQMPIWLSDLFLRNPII
jgi:hypothetical protein